MKHSVHCVIATLLVASASAATCHIRVDPAVDALHDAARRLEQQQFDVAPASRHDDIHVCLEPGVHRLTKPLTITSAHNHPSRRGSLFEASGKPGRVVWRPRGEFGSAVVSGGVQLTDWWNCDDGEHCPGQDWHLVYAHAVTGLPNVSTTSLPFRQLWVGGKRAARVAQPPSAFGLKPTSSGYSATSLPADASSWVSTQAEFRWPSQIRNWIEPRCIVTDVQSNADGSGAITVAPQCWQGLTSRNDGKLPPVPAWMENGGPLPPGPGEFYSTPDYIFYRPSTSEPYQPPTDAWVPTLPVLLVLEGVTGHDLAGLSFSHGTWRAPSQPGGYVPSQTLVSNQGEPEGAVRFIQASRDVSVRNCTFSNIGTAYALEISGATQVATVSDSTFTDLSGGAVKLANVNDTRALSNDTADWDSNYTLTNCFISEASVEFRGGAAVFAGYIANYSATHNTVQQTGYTGFSTGWGWGAFVHGPQTFARDNVLTNNVVIDPMSALNDGGCFYTLGPSPNSLCEGNVCSGDRAPVVGGIYRDNGSRFWTVKNNVVDGTPAPCVYLQGCCDSPAYNISVSDVWCRATAPIRNECQPQGCDVDNATITYLNSGDPWPAQAQAIINAAGASV